MHSILHKLTNRATPLRAMVLDTGLLSGGRALAALLLILSAALIARFRTQVEFAAFQQLWTIYITIAGIVTLGLDRSPYVELPSRAKEERATVVLEVGILLLAAGALAGTAVYVFAHYVEELFRDPALIDPLRAFAPYIALTMPTFALEAVLMSNGLLKRLIAWVIGARALLFLASTLPLILGYSLTVTFAVVSGCGLVQLVFAWLLIRSILKGRQDPVSFRGLGRQLAIALPIGVTYTFGTLFIQVDKLVVARHFSTETYAIYQAGAIEIPIVGLLTGALATVQLPRLTACFQSRDFPGLLSLWNQSARLMAQILIPLTGLLLLLSKDIVVLVYSDKYASSALIFALFLLLLPLRIANYGYLMLSIGQQRKMMYINCAMILPLFLAAGLGAHVGGIAGVAVAVVMTNYALNGLMLRTAVHTLGCGYGDIFPWRSLAGILASCLVAGSLAWGLAHLLPISGLLADGLVLSTYVVTYVLLARSMSWFAHGESAPKGLDMSDEPAPPSQGPYQKTAFFFSYNFPPMLTPGSLRASHMAKYLPAGGWKTHIFTARNGLSMTKTMGDDGASIPHAEVQRIHDPDPFKALLNLWFSSHAPGGASSGNSFQRGWIRKLTDLSYLVFFPDRDLLWAIWAARAALLACRKQRPSVIYSSSPNISNHVAAYIVHSFTGIPWVAEFRDLWSRDSYFWRPRLRRWLEFKLENLIVRNAAATVAISNEHARSLRETHPNVPADRFHVVTNGFDPEEQERLRPHVRPDRFVLAHAGTCYGGKRDLRPVMRAVVALRKHNPTAGADVELLMIGVREQCVLDWAIEAGIEDLVRFTGPVPYSRALDELSRSSALFLVTNVDYPEMPLKFFDYLCARRPVIAVCPPGSEIEARLRDASAGVAIAHSDQAALDAEVLRAYQDWRSGGSGAPPDEESLAQYRRSVLALRLGSIFSGIASDIPSRSSVAEPLAVR